MSPHNNICFYGETKKKKKKKLRYLLLTGAMCIMVRPVLSSQGRGVDN